MPQQIVSRSATELAYIEKTVQNIDVSFEDNWSFEFGLEKGFYVPIFNILGFMQLEQFPQ